MDAITLTAVVDEARRLTIDVPADVPVGPVELTITPLTRPLAAPDTLTPDVARQKLMAAGVLSTTRYAPDGAVSLSEDERDCLGRLFIGPPSIDTLVDEDRGSV